MTELLNMLKHCSTCKNFSDSSAEQSSTSPVQSHAKTKSDYSTWLTQALSQLTIAKLKGVRELPIVKPCSLGFWRLRWRNEAGDVKTFFDVVMISQRGPALNLMIFAP